MRVKFLHEKQLQLATADGPGLRVFEEGEEVDLPDMQGQMYVTNGDAIVLALEPAEETPEPPAPEPASTEPPQTEPAPAAPAKPRGRRKQ